MDVRGESAWTSLARVRATAPLIHNITNFVVMNTTANALLALGASPVMAHAIDEVVEMVELAGSLVLNIGTLSPPWTAAMLQAGLAAKARGIPVVLDPVGAGATRMRTAWCRRLLDEVRPTIVRGNASEILALVARDGAPAGTKGVDSTAAVTTAVEAGRALARRHGCVVSISGPVDVIVSTDAIVEVHNGHPMMPKVTGMGCTASALTGAIAAVEPSPFVAATHTMVLNGIAGELAGERAVGPGSFQMHFLDVLYLLSQADVAQRARVTPG